MKLPELDQDRAFFHLGFFNLAGIDAGDIAQCYEAFNTIKSEYMLNRVQEQLDICDEAWESCKSTRTGFRYGIRENYVGDINRAIVRENAKDLRVWQENYGNECMALAKLLHVPNYQQDNQRRYMYERAGSSYINVIPGVADSAVSSRKLEFNQLAGSFGTL